VGDALVGRCSKQKKNLAGVWYVDAAFLFRLLGSGFCKLITMRILFLCIVLGLISCAKKREVTAVAKSAPTPLQQEVNQLPIMLMVDKDNVLTDAHKLKGKNIIILFFPDCEHCKREATEMAERIKSFDGYTLYFLSINPFEEILKFAQDHKLNNLQNVKFVQTTGDAIFANFGAVQTPSLYIYNHEKLVKKFNGETNVDEIVRYL
jgi:peroxiredoxin